MFSVYLTSFSALILLMTMLISDAFLSLLILRFFPNMRLHFNALLPMSAVINTNLSTFEYFRPFVNCSLAHARECHAEPMSLVIKIYEHKDRITDRYFAFVQHISGRYFKRYHSV